MKEPNVGEGQGNPGSSVRSTEDLAGRLFMKNHAMVGVVRDLLQRNKRTQLAKLRNDWEAPANGSRSNFTAVDNAEACSEAEGTDVEAAKITGIYVLGDASTVADLRSARQPNAGGAQMEPILKQPHQPQAQGPLLTPTESNAKVVGKENARNLPTRTDTGWMCLTGALETFQELADLVRLYPSTLFVPLVAFLLLAGLGTWGVIEGAKSHVKSRKDDVHSQAVDAATGFQIQLQQSFTPGVTFTLLVRQRPDWSYWMQNFDQTAAELLSRVPKGSLWNLQLQPLGQVMSIYPLRPEDSGQINPPRDLMGDPTRREDYLRGIRTHAPFVNGPVWLVQRFWGAFVRYPIYVPDVDPEETFGFRYRENATALPYGSLPASVRNCSICYNATTREKWWGTLTALVNYGEVTQGQDAYLATLRSMKLHYALVRPLNATHEDVIAQMGPSDLRGQEAVTVPVRVLNGEWLLRVAPADGFAPSWRGSLVAAVIIIALIITSLLFLSLVSFRRQRLQLQQTMAVNRDLAETTKRLEEEKERMDVLLVRQYDLLRCLDANRTGAKRSGEEGDGDSRGGSRADMMERIEDARRSLNVAKATSGAETIQVFEVLGAGAFGKVQRGLWRGTVVAVKTMILPANMTGQQKREKMAVMEAAISSSLVHPNIVTTYTYFIRPYHEPTHEGVQQMVIGTSDGSFSHPTQGSGERSCMSTEVPIHSYEVRLVLEFCDKGSLKDALEQHAFMQGGAFNLAAMLETAADIAKAMVHMHAANVLHSDLKARNIMLKSSGTEGRGVTAKVADFGLSTRMEHQETHLSSCFQGTLTHMAPEVMLKGRISKAADVYSFGIVMWELFCGGDPFAGVPRAHIGHAITIEARRPRFPSFAPRDFVALAARCWDPDAAMRPSFEEVLVELMRMREELGSDTQPLIITPPKPLSPVHSGEGTAGGGQGGMTRGGSMMGGGSGVTPVGMNVQDNPLAINSNMSGIMLGGNHGGGDSTVGYGSSTGAVGNGGGTGVATWSGLGVGEGGGGGRGGFQGVGYGNVSMAQRSISNSALTPRHLRKMGIRLGGPSGASGLGPSLAALHEEMSETREGEPTG